MNAQAVESFIIMLESFVANLELEDDEPAEAVTRKAAKLKTDDLDLEGEAAEAEGAVSAEVEGEPEEAQVDKRPTLDLPPVWVDRFPFAVRGFFDARTTRMLRRGHSQSVARFGSR